MKTEVRTVGIIGAGPAGLALASFLALRGLAATVFDDAKRPDLLVGEPLVPGIVPVLRRLGQGCRSIGYPVVFYTEIRPKRVRTRRIYEMYFLGPLA